MVETIRMMLGLSIRAALNAFTKMTMSLTNQMAPDQPSHLPRSDRILYGRKQVDEGKIPRFRTRSKTGTTRKRLDTSQFIPHRKNEYLPTRITPSSALDCCILVRNGFDNRLCERAEKSEAPSLRGYFTSLRRPRRTNERYVYGRPSPSFSFSSSLSFHTI